jgi:hypothetical protein
MIVFNLADEAVMVKSKSRKKKWFYILDAEDALRTLGVPRSEREVLKKLRRAQQHLRGR